MSFPISVEIRTEILYIVYTEETQEGEIFKRLEASISRELGFGQTLKYHNLGRPIKIFFCQILYKYSFWQKYLEACRPK